MDRAAWLHLDDDVVQRQADAEPVLLSLESHRELVRLLDGALGGRRPVEHLVEEASFLLAPTLLLLGHARVGGRLVRLGRSRGSLGRPAGLLLALCVHGVVLGLHLQVELLVVVVERVLVERHPCGGVVVVDAALWIEALLPALWLGCLQRLVCDPEEVGVLLDVHAQVLGVLEHVGDGALEVVLRPHVLLRGLLARVLPAYVGDDGHVEHVRVGHLPIGHLLLELVELLRVALPVGERSSADCGESSGVLLLGSLVLFLRLLFFALLSPGTPLERELARALKALLPILLLRLLFLLLLLQPLLLLGALASQPGLLRRAQLVLLLAFLALLRLTLGLLF
mmetsp:Transcript_25412/g.54902  ORF Transcript_25412/g.54902 Transcript_25412/m.54902 type:complete len:339 (+) Transcript_25412:986-2002(+)